MTHEKFALICKKRQPTPDEVADWARARYIETLIDCQSDPDLENGIACICFGSYMQGTKNIAGGLSAVNASAPVRLEFIKILINY